MTPEDKSISSRQPDSMAEKIDSAIDRNQDIAIADSFLIEHPHLSRRAVDKIVLERRKNKKPIFLNRPPKI